MIVYVYPKCSTCKAALHFLKQRGVACEVKDITKQRPSKEELQAMLGCKKNIKQLMNTSGLLYKEMELKEKLSGFSEEEIFSLLNQHGMLVKRPFLLGKGFGLLGFKEEEWTKVFA